MTENPVSPRSLTWRTRLLSRALALCLALLAAALTEALAVVFHNPNADSRLALFLGAFGKIQVFALLVAVSLAALSLAASALVSRLRAQGLLGPSGNQQPIDLIAATLLVAPVATLLSYCALFALARGAKNLELAALAGTVVSSCIAYLALLPWAFFVLVSRARREHLAPSLRGLVLLPGALVSLLVLGALWRGTGIAQLDPWLFAVPGVALGALALTAHLAQRRTLAVPKLVLAGLAASSLLALLGSAGTEATSARLFRTGAWSRPAIALLRRITDFDHDGYSGWFDGGDCAPFDARVHPGAREIPRDGLDNNCLGGDGGHDAPGALPRAKLRERAKDGPQLNLVLLTIETLRADHVSFLGYARPTTPRLAELAKSSVVFERSYATTPTTRLSLTALLSGKLPSSIRWLNQSHEKQMRRLSPETFWLPEALNQQGYATLAVLTDFRAFTQQENAGFSRGFTRYDTSTELAYSGGTMHGFPGGAQVDRALALLDETAGRPLFLWLHLLEPHYLYQQSPDVPRFGADELARYDAEIAEADRQVGRLLDGLRARQLLDTTLFVVTGDHGEEFGEHGQRWHGSNLYEPQLRTATLWHVPGLGPKRVSAPVSFLDFVPTLLDLLGLEGELEPSLGRNLAPLLREGKPVEPGFFIENFKVDDGTQYLLGLVDWPFKLLRTGPDAPLELYDLARDPTETRDLWRADEPVSRRLSNRLYEYLESGLARGVTQDPRP